MRRMERKQGASTAVPMAARAGGCPNQEKEVAEKELKRSRISKKMEQGAAREKKKKEEED